MIKGRLSFLFKNATYSNLYSCIKILTPEYSVKYCSKRDISSLLPKPLIPITRRIDLPGQILSCIR